MDQKYVRTYHLPFSPGGSRDDLVLASTAHFQERHVVITVKMDGENTTMTRDSIYARSVSSDMGHPSRTFVKRLWGNIKHEIPKGFRLVGENMYAKHSIFYDY